MSDIQLNKAKADYNANKNNVDIMKIQNTQAMHQSSNETKQGKILIDSMKGVN